MVTKKKYHGLLKVLLSLLFTMLFVCYSTSYANISEPFSVDELSQINDFFNINITQTTLNNAYNYLKNKYSTLSKLNIIFVYGSNTQNGTNYLYLICNNGTFSNEVDYLKITPWSSTYFKVTSIDNINDTVNHTFYFTRINVSNSYITGLESSTDLKIWTGENPPFTLNSSFFASNRLLTTRNTATFYAYTTNDTIRVVLSTNYIILDDYVQPEEPSGDVPISTGTITNPSGDITGQINLSGIENGITNIQNQISGDSQRIIDNQNQNTQTIVNTISGEVGKITSTLTDNANDTIDNTIITSGDIENALGFEIAQDPYFNFWITLTNNLKNALLGTKRSIDISFHGRTWTISLDEYMVLPAWLTIILIPISTAFFTWLLVRQWKHIFDKLSSGNIDSILKENSEERHF